MVDVRPRHLQCVVVSPERALFDEPADFVALPMYDGELGVLPGRAPLIGRLGYGELRIRRGEMTKRFFVDGGFVQVVANTVTVLTSKAVPAEEIRPEKVQEAMREVRGGQAKVAGAEAQEVQIRAQDKLRSQLRVAQHVGARGG